MEHQQLLEVAKTLASGAAERILQYYGTNIPVEIKVEEEEGTITRSPLTIADTEANSIITAGLRHTFPNIPILSEEDEDDTRRLKAEYVWVVDPLDGTKEFLSENGEFTVNIGLLYQNIPILGVIDIPARGVQYIGSSDGAFRIMNGKTERIQVTHKNKPQDCIIAASRSHVSRRDLAFIERVGFRDVVTAGSSLKGCLIADGTVDAIIRYGNQHDWDIVAMVAIIIAAGGAVTDLEGNPLRWNQEQPIIRGYLASNRCVHEALLRSVAQ